MKGRKQRLTSGDEYDVIYARRMYCYLTNRPKNVSDVKRRLNKRERRDCKQSIREEIDNER